MQITFSIYVIWKTWDIWISTSRITNNSLEILNSSVKSAAGLRKASSTFADPVSSNLEPAYFRLPKLFPSLLPISANLRVGGAAGTWHPAEAPSPILVPQPEQSRLTPFILIVAFSQREKIRLKRRTGRAGVGASGNLTMHGQNAQSCKLRFGCSMAESSSVVAEMSVKYPYKLDDL
jgi:hypothetical protein